MKRSLLALALFALSISAWAASPVPEPVVDWGMTPLGAGFFMFDTCPTQRGCPWLLNPSGVWNYLHIDANGALMLGGGGPGVAATSACPTSGGCPFALNPSGAWVNLNTDANGNLLTSSQSGGGQASTVAPSGSITNTPETIFLTMPTLPVNRLVAGSTLRFTIIGNYSAGAAVTNLFKIHAGTAGTISDATACSITTPATATSGSSIPFRAIVEWTVRVPGATATSACEYTFINQGITGIATSIGSTATGTTANFDTTSALIITLSGQTGSASNSMIITQTFGEFVYK